MSRCNFTILISPIGNPTVHPIPTDWVHFCFAIAFLWLGGNALRVFPHVNRCVTFVEHPLYLDRGVYITPTIIEIPSNGCADEYVKRLKHLLDYLSDDSLTVPASEHAPNTHGRTKRFASLVLGGLSTILATISLGTGISSAVELDKLKETVTFIENHQDKISFELATLTARVLELTTEHHNGFMALRQEVELAKAQTEYNSCKIGLNKLDDTIQSVLSQKLTHHIIPTRDVLSFLHSNSVLKDSLYVRYPRLVYKLGKIELVSLNVDKRLFTILVLLPHLSAVPDGFIYRPLYSPRFFVNEDQNQSLVEHFPSIPPLFSLNGPFDGRLDLLSMDESKCLTYGLFSVCPLTAQYFAPDTTCSNYLLNNVTGSQLHRACGFSLHPSPRTKWTSLSESSTYLLIFSNQNVKGISASGYLDVVSPFAPPSCVLINKIHLSSLRIGDRNVILNFRSDAFSLAPEEREVVRAIHALQRDDVVDRESLPVSHLDPRSRFFTPSLLMVVGTSGVVFLGACAVTMAYREVRHKLALYRLNQVGDPLRRSHFLGIFLRRRNVEDQPANPLPLET